MIYEHDHYRSYLKQVLVDRIQKNENYSLRAFASQIDVSPSMLSEVLKGEKKLSATKAAGVAAKLNLAENEEQYFLSLVQLDHATTVPQRERILNRMTALAPERDTKDLTVDQFHSVANWICVAGITLVSSVSKGLTAKQIADRLKVTPFEVDEAMRRWLNLEILEFKSDRYVRSKGENLLMESQAPNGALRAFHKTMLEKAVDSLETQTNDEKRVGSETFGFDVKHLSQASDIIEDAIAKLLKLAKQSTKKEVYHFGFQLFKLTQGKTK